MNVCLSLATPAQLNVMVAQVEGGVYQPESARESFWLWTGDTPKYSKSCPNYLNDPEFILNVIKGQQMSIGSYSTGEWYASNGYRAATGKTLEEAVLRCYVRHAKCQTSDDVDIPKEFV
jgi:hypothetical protein